MPVDSGMFFVYKYIIHINIYKYIYINKYIKHWANTELLYWDNQNMTDKVDF